MNNSAVGRILARASTKASHLIRFPTGGFPNSTQALTSKDHEAGHEHFVDDVNDPIIRTHIGLCDGRTINLYAFQQG